MRVGVRVVPRVCGLLTGVNSVVVFCSNAQWHLSKTMLGKAPLHMYSHTCSAMAACRGATRRIVRMDVLAVPPQTVPNLRSRTLPAATRMMRHAVLKEPYRDMRGLLHNRNSLAPVGFDLQALLELVASINHSQASYNRNYHTLVAQLSALPAASLTCIACSVRDIIPLRDIDVGRERCVRYGVPQKQWR